MDTCLGHIIKEEVARQGLTADQFADLICTSRTNVYNIFERENFDMELLVRISQALHRNFFVEISREMSSRLGNAAPAAMANRKLASLTHPLRSEMEGIFFSSAEYTKNREELKQVLREFFKSDHRMPLLILESGHTFGAREVVKQVATEVFAGNSSAPCPRLIDPSRAKAMSARVFIDYIDRDTYDSIEESDRRVSSLCQVAREVAKKLVCIIHTEPFAALPGSDGVVSFDQWGSEMPVFYSRHEQCFIAVYRWDRASLLSWAQDAGLHEQVLNYIAHHHVGENEERDFQLSHACLSMGTNLLGLPATIEDIDYPTPHAYPQRMWELASQAIAGVAEKDNLPYWNRLVQDIERFNSTGDQQPWQHLTTIECYFDVNGVSVENAKLKLPETVVGTLAYLRELAVQTDFKDLDEETVEEQLYAWIVKCHPQVAQALVDAAEEVVNSLLLYDNDELHWRKNIPHYEPQSAEDGWQVMEGLEYNFILYDLPKWR